MKLVTFFAFGFIIFLSSNIQAQEKFITGNSDQSMNYSLIGKVEKNKPYSEAWIKGINIDNKASKNNLANFRANKIEIRSNQKLSTEGYKKYLYAMYHYQVDCNGNKIRIIEIDDYNENGKLLAKEKITDDWVNMIAGTIQYKIGKVVCGN